MREIKFSLENTIEYFHLIIKSLLKLNLIFVIFLSVFRYLLFKTYAESSQYSFFSVETLKAFWMGLRFDLSIIGYVNFPIILFLVVAILFRKRRLFDFFSRFSPLYYVLFFGLISALIGINFEFFAYFQDHLNILVFDFFTDDTWALLKTFWQNYPIIWIALGFSLYIYLLYKLCVKLLRKGSFTARYGLPMSFRQRFYLLLYPVVVLAFCIFISRGTFSTFPLGMMDAVVSSDAFINKIPLNAVITFQRALKDKIQEWKRTYDNISFYGYEDDIRKAFADYLEVPVSSLDQDLIESISQVTSEKAQLEEKPPHVVVLIMESFGSQWLKYQSENFNVMGALEPHFKQDIYLPNFISATGGTLGSLLAITMNLPRMVYGPYLSESEYLRVPLRTSSALPFKEKGYQTRFIYGGSVGWRNLNRYLPNQGYDYVEGESVIVEKVHAPLSEMKETWGVYDEYWLEYIFQVLENAEKPQMIIGLSTTNHPPYKLPASYRKFPLQFPAELEARFTGDKDLVRDHFETYQYSNHVLGLFLQRLKQSKLAQNTVVVITGDHHFNVMNYDDSEALEREMVPFYLYAPDDLKPKNFDPHVFGSHQDILPTLYHLTLSKQKFYSLGKNLFDPKQEHFGYNNSSLIISKDGAAIVQDAIKSVGFTWNETRTALIPSDGTQQTNKLARQFRAAQSMTEYILKQEKVRFKSNQKH